MGIYVLLFLSIILILFRILYMILKTYGNIKVKERRQNSARTVICIGSGGHTTEMINLIEKLDFKTKYRPRFYIIADTDSTSETKIHDLESKKKVGQNSYSIFRIPRSREVNQSYITSVFTTVYSFFKCMKLVYKLKPNLVLCNGPGSTCIPVSFVGFGLKLFFLNTDLMIVFIESICRVKTLSLTGKILYFFSDYFIVQWPLLKLKFQKAIYLGTFFK